MRAVVGSGTGFTMRPAWLHVSQCAPWCFVHAFAFSLLMRVFLFVLLFPFSFSPPPTVNSYAPGHYTIGGEIVDLVLGRIRELADTLAQCSSATPRFDMLRYSSSGLRRRSPWPMTTLSYTTLAIEKGAIALRREKNPRSPIVRAAREPVIVPPRRRRPCSRNASGWRSACLRW